MSRHDKKQAVVFFFAAGYLLVSVAIGAAQLVSLKFVYSGSGGNTDTLKFGYDAGYFKKRGLDLTMIYVTSGVITAQTVVSGTVAGAAATITDVLRALARGAPMKIIMVTMDRFDQLFVARPGIDSPNDLLGKRIAVSRYGAFSDIQSRFLIRYWGMEPDKDVQIVQIGNSAARSAALISGGIDAAVMSPSFIPVSKKAGLNVMFDLSTIQSKFAVRGVVVSNRLIEEQPQAVKAIVAGYVDGVKDWRVNSAAAKAYLKKSYKTSDAETEALYTDANRFLRLEPTPDLEGIQNAWESFPDLRKRKDVDLRKFIDTRFVHEVLKETR